MSSYFKTRETCSHHNIFPGVDIYTTTGKEMMLSYVTFEPGAVVEAHSHPHEQVGMVVEGKARFFVGDEEQLLGPGDMYTIPGGVTHRVVAEKGRVVALDIFHPIRDDYV